MQCLFRSRMSPARVPALVSVFAFALAVASSTLVAATAAAGPWTVIAEKDDPVPGVPSATFYGRSFWDVKVNDQGMVGFEGHFERPGENFETRALHVWVPGQGLRMVFEPGVTLDQDGQLVGSPIMTSMNNQGTLAFSSYAFPGFADVVHTVDLAGNAYTLAKTGDPAPGVPGQTLTVQNDPDLWLDDAGGLTFPGWVGAPFSGDEVIWRQSTTGGPLTPRVGAGAAWPTPDPSAVFSQSHPSEVRVNTRGDLAMSASGLPGASPRGLIRVPVSAATPTVLIHEGDAAPGMTNRVMDLSGRPFGGQSWLTLDDSGRAAFAAHATIPGTNLKTLGIWREKRNGNIELIAESGQPIGGEFNWAWADVLAVAANASGQTAFLVESGGGAEALYIAEADGAVRKVFETGGRAIGIDEDRDTRSLDFAPGFLNFNENGDALFRVAIAPAHGGSEEGEALYLYNTGRDAIELVIAENEELVTTDGRARPVDYFDTYFPSEQNQTTRGKMLNAAGQVALDVTFVSSRFNLDAGVYLYDPLPAVPRGDYNGNGQVEQGDLDLVLQNWGEDAPDPIAGWVAHNIGIGTIDQNELDGVLQNWGSTNAPDFRGTSLPEPMAAVTGLLMLLVARHRRLTP